MDTSQIGRVALTFAALALLASCGSSDAASGSGDSGSSANLVSVASVEGADVLVDARAHTLYSAEVEKGGQIRCVDTCTSFWEPVLASAGDIKKASGSLRAALGVVNRPGGQSQLTFEGLPLYRFAEEGAGELRGEGITDDFQGTTFVWAAATTDGSVGTSGTPSPDPGHGY